MKQILLLAILLLSGCASVHNYNCGRLKGEPQWHPVSLSKPLKITLLNVAEKIEAEGLLKPDYPLSNTKYWYFSDNGGVLLCVTGRYSYPKSSIPTCFVDRYFFEKKGGDWVVQSIGGIVCTG